MHSSYCIVLYLPVSYSLKLSLNNGSVKREFCNCNCNVGSLLILSSKSLFGLNEIEHDVLHDKVRGLGRSLILQD